MNAVYGNVQNRVSNIHSYRFSIDGHFGVFAINDKFVTFLRRDDDIAVNGLACQLIQFTLVYDHKTQVPLLWIPDHHDGVVLVAVADLQGNDAQMVVRDLDDDLLGPDLLVDQLLTVVDRNDKVDSAFKDQRLMLRDVQTEKEGILGGGIETEGQLPFLLPRDLLRVNEYLLHTESIPFAWVYQGDLELLYL